MLFWLANAPPQRSDLGAVSWRELSASTLLLNPWLMHAPNVSAAALVAKAAAGDAETGESAAPKVQAIGGACAKA